MIIKLMTLVSHILVNVDHDDSGNHVNVKNNDDLNSVHMCCRFSGCVWSD